MAKGVEDTSFYVYMRFLSSNEVGSSMKSFGIPVSLFHEANQQRLADTPHSMLGTSTHDTKRSEDVRNRLNVISELPDRWPQFVRRWARLNEKFKTRLDDGRVAPDPNEEYLIYQTIAGSWPWQMNGTNDRQDYLERILTYIQKALSEAKVNTSWIQPDEAYVDAEKKFIEQIIRPGPRGKESGFVAALKELLPLLETFGAVNSLAQVVLKIASPGVPDFYQGTDVWDLSLVDPDNRRPVDYKLRSDALAAMRGKAEREGAQAVCTEVLENLRDGRVKLWTMHRGLQLRNRLAGVFSDGAYAPLSATGRQSENVVAFSRGGQVIAAVPLFACTMMGRKPQLPLGEAWGDAALDAGEFAGAELENVFTDERLRVPGDGKISLAQVFAGFPVALLAKV
jgi:(1->4)-alpha-D-glucan 1-alpha-D-glucosylmutase